jgi:hypothetical protein
MRQELGRLLLAAGKPAEAERAFREDLANYPENVWSGRGLEKALAAQEKSQARQVPPYPAARK